MTSQISLFNDRLQQQLEILQVEYQRLNHQKGDYEALENLLHTLPDTTSKAAMIPLGKFAFMPGKIIHTNEILTCLGDQYYAERSAKQAIEILGRRKEGVSEKLLLLTTKMDELNSKSKALLDTGILSEAQVNEEGLPIMEIREEWPEEKEIKTIKQVEEKRPVEALPPSVQRARDMMNQQTEKKLDEDKALFDMLKELEEEEEEEDEEEILGSGGGQKKPWLKELNQLSDQEDSNDEEDERYDMEIAEDIFDKFAEENDEEYPLDGIVDQDDFTYYDQDESYEKSTPSVITKPKNKRLESKEEPDEEPKIEVPLQQTVAETVAEKVTESGQEEKAPKKKMSKFKLLKQQERKKKPVESPEEEKQVKKVSKFKQQKNDAEKMNEQQKESISEESVKEEKKDPPKKVSKFKMMKQQEKKKDTVEPVKEEHTTKEEPITKEETTKEETPKEEPTKKSARKVTWDANATVIEHENHDAPSVLSETDSYSQPIKTEASQLPISKIRSAHDIARVIHQTSQAIDDYPSLEDDAGPQTVDLNDLIKLAREKIQEPFYRPTDGAMVPIPKQVGSQEEGGIIIAKKSKLDNKIMKGSVMERETADVDLDELEEDMELREITTKYHEKRQQMLASTGSLSFEPKPEFEIFDEDLPLPNNKSQEEEEEEEEEEFVPKKMSRFKAARLGIKDY